MGVVAVMASLYTLLAKEPHSRASVIFTPVIDHLILCAWVGTIGTFLWRSLVALVQLPCSPARWWLAGCLVVILWWYMNVFVGSDGVTVASAFLGIFVSVFLYPQWYPLWPVVWLHVSGCTFWLHAAPLPRLNVPAQGEASDPEEDWEDLGKQATDAEGSAAGSAAEDDGAGGDESGPVDAGSDAGLGPCPPDTPHPTRRRLRAGGADGTCSDQEAGRERIPPLGTVAISVTEESGLRRRVPPRAFGLGYDVHGEQVPGGTALVQTGVAGRTRHPSGYYRTLHEGVPADELSH